MATPAAPQQAPESAEKGKSSSKTVTDTITGALSRLEPRGGTLMPCSQGSKTSSDLESL